jgi:hypothetical protein
MKSTVKYTQFPIPRPFSPARVSAWYIDMSTPFYFCLIFGVKHALALLSFSM